MRSGLRAGRLGSITARASAIPEEDNMKGKVVCGLLAALSLASIACEAQWAYVHPKLRSQQFIVRSAVMLPPIVELPKQEGVDGGGAVGRETTDEIGSGVSEALTARGMAVTNPFTTDAL